MVVKAVKHETDEGKWQSNFDEYGHGEGTGKSRNSIYKHYIKMEKIFPDESQNQWVGSDWMNDEEGEGEVKAKTIPKPLSDMAAGKLNEFDFKAQGKIVRTAYIGLDRLITHWGRGVMSDDSWSIERSSEDLDTLEMATVNMLNYYNVRIPISPPMIWSVTIGSAYAPPISHVMKNRDPNRKRRSLIPRIFRRKKKVAKDEGEDK